MHVVECNQPSIYYFCMILQAKLDKPHCNVASSHHLAAISTVLANIYYLVAGPLQIIRSSLVLSVLINTQWWLVTGNYFHVMIFYFKNMTYAPLG